MLATDGNIALAFGEAVAERTVELDFASHVLGHLLRDARERKISSDTPLTYRAVSAESLRASARASASGVLDRIHKDLGLYHDDTSADSVRRWRIKTTYNILGTHAATTISGISEDRMRDLIGITKTADPMPTAGAHVGGFLN
jgi:hypothetical protein